MSMAVLSLREMALVHRVPFLGMRSSGLNCPIIELIDHDDREWIEEHEIWKFMVATGQALKPNLPAKFIRVVEAAGGKPTMFFDECGQWHPAAAPGSAARERATASERWIEHRTAVTLSDALESFLPPSFAQEADILEYCAEQAKLAKQAQRPLFLTKNLEPLSVARWLQAENPDPDHEWII